MNKVKDNKMANQNNPDLGKRIENLEKELNRVKILYEKTIKYQREDPEISLAQEAQGHLHQFQNVRK